MIKIRARDTGYDATTIDVHYKAIKCPINYSLRTKTDAIKHASNLTNLIFLFKDNNVWNEEYCRFIKENL